MPESVVPRRQYTKEFKADTVRLAESVGQHECTSDRARYREACHPGSRSERSRRSGADEAPQTFSGSRVFRKPVALPDRDRGLRWLARLGAPTGWLWASNQAHSRAMCKTNLAPYVLSIPINFPIMRFYQLWHERSHHSGELRRLRGFVTDPVTSLA
ncbi:hypothetical protein [Burkholderia sp. LMG 32019]|uniref:hypothetical protein n=1 Tax=Burkholderia sp. LMG 32019 TaxID=3158173 RepID=UPI003C304CEA